jgi:Icc-related predicted phosphoesterase
MKVCFTSDIHGSAALYAALQELLREETPDLVILGGDLLSDGEPPEDPAGQLREVQELLLPRLIDWTRTIPTLHIGILGGNHDWAPSVEWLCSNVKPPIYVLSLEPVTIAGVHVIGFGHTPWTPHGLKDFERLDVTGDEVPPSGGYAFDAQQGCTKQVSADEHFNAHPALSEMLEACPTFPKPLIFVAHAPPNDTGLDLLPSVDGPVGSRAVRAFIESQQPIVSLHGHVHESYSITGCWQTQIGKTLCINPGQEEDRLHAVLFETADPARTLQHTVL